jgi:hypothetical protein
MDTYLDQLEKAKGAALRLSRMLKSLNNNLIRGVGVLRSSDLSGYDLCIYLTESYDPEEIPDDFEGYKVRHAIRKPMKLAAAY